jgi:hypothetical protein
MNVWAATSRPAQTQARKPAFDEALLQAMVNRINEDASPSSDPQDAPRLDTTA